VDVLRVGIERRQGPDDAQQHTHRVGVVAKAFQELGDVGVDVGVELDRFFPRLELGLGGQLALAQQVGHLEEARALGQLLDRVATVPQDAPVAVDEGDGAPARGRVHEGRIVRHHAEVVARDLDLAQVRGLDGLVLDRHLVALAGAVVRDRERVFGHEPAPS
jgi:hypothetical protein